MALRLVRLTQGHFRPKDLFDLYLMATSGAHLLADRDALATAVELAFSSLGYPIDRVVRVASRRFALGKASLRAWARWRASVLDELAEDGRLQRGAADSGRGGGGGGAFLRGVVNVPASPTEAVAAIAPVCCDCLERLGYAVIEGDDDDAPIAERWKVEQLRRVEVEASSRMIDRTASGRSAARRGGGGSEVDEGGLASTIVAEDAATVKTQNAKSFGSIPTGKYRAAEPPPPLSSSPSPSTSLESSSAVPTPEILFVMSGANEVKWLEAQKVLAEWSTLIVPHSYRPPRELRFPPGLAEGTVTPTQVAENLALHCRGALGKPCIVDLTCVKQHSHQSSE